MRLLLWLLLLLLLRVVLHQNQKHPRHATPHHTPRRHTTPHHTTPHRTTPHHTTPHHTTPHHTTPHHTIPSGPTRRTPHHAIRPHHAHTPRNPPAAHAPYRLADMTTPTHSSADCIVRFLGMFKSSLPGGGGDVLRAGPRSMTHPSTLYSYSCLQSCNLDPERGVADRLGCSSTDLGSGDASCLQQPLPDEDAHSCGESDIGDEELGKDPCFVILEDRPSLGRRLSRRFRFGRRR